LLMLRDYRNPSGDLSTRSKDARFSPMHAENEFYIGLQKSAEAFLTKRKRRRLRRKMKQQAKHWLVDWIEAIVWAACVVLVINQYLFQMYRIPSESMVGTLNVGDMIFVNKFIYGPELLPGVAKLPGLAEPRRGQVIVFENPSYISRGPVFTIAQQLVYMLTLTAVDIDRDDAGNPKVHYLIKRAVAVGGDRVRIREGDVEYRFAGTSRWIPEKEYKEASGASYPTIRSVTPGEYPAIREAGVAAAFEAAGVPRDSSLGAGESANGMIRYKDQLEFAYAQTRVIYSLAPQESRFAQAYRRMDLGWYIPQGRVFPMGDNRDNSRDARWFGPVPDKRVLGRARFIYWPATRIGPIR